MLAARISLTLSRHSSLSFIALGRSSGQQPVSSHSCWMYVRAGRPAFARPCVGIHKSTSPMSSSLLLQQCPACQWYYFTHSWECMEIHPSHEYHPKVTIITSFKCTTLIDIAICAIFVAYWVEFLTMVRETGVQSKVESYQRLKKWYLILLCLALSTIKWGSRVKWINPGSGVMPSPTPRCSSYWKGSVRVTLY